MTPQTFRYGDLKKLYQTDLLNAQETPSTFALYMKSGKAIYCSKGSEKNIKLTYPEDILYFKKCLRNDYMKKSYRLKKKENISIDFIGSTQLL